MNSRIVANPVDDKHLYEREYFDGYYLNDKRREAMYKQEYKRILERTHFGRVLDIGCGVGGFLQTFDDRWDKYGIEPSDFAAEKAKAKGINMLRNIQSVGYDFMDVVIFRGSLQHINFPMRELSQATKSLRPGGLLVILATPDTDSLVYKLWGRLPALDAPRNWILFGNRMLSNILKRFEYDEIEIIHPYLGTPYANPVNDFSKFSVSLVAGWRPFAFPGNMMEVYARKRNG
jgi:SAM-dependent methyltransferase